MDLPKEQGSEKEGVGTPSVTADHQTPEPAVLRAPSELKQQGAVWSPENEMGPPGLVSSLPLLPRCRRKMPFHHVTAGLLYKGNYLSRSLSDGSDSDQLANISVEELDEIREAFRVLDRDGNGFISKQELGMAMRSLGYMPSEVELAIIMQRLDMDGDGQVDFDEFMTILGPKLLSSETREGFLGNTIDTIFWQVRLIRPFFIFYFE
ncbi:hypothetical protein Z043_115876 [Scleropages formosus]|uniref:EF-hand domain-containing protein n=1 Tax=Scleropages formosus TaxID=113540 RepID=A0A0P7UD82_SCLFO|nr:hypothetical protein Z043_115876 [Scleropages formosus]